MGGVVAFEIARRLQAHGQEVALCALLDAEFGVVGSSSIDTGKMVEVFDGLNLSQLAPTLQELDADRQAESVLERLQWGDQVFPNEFLEAQRLLHLYKANVQALNDYVPRRYSGQIVLIESGDMATDEARARRRWERLALGRVRVFRVPGNHRSMLRDPHVRSVAEQLKTCLHEADTLTVDINEV